MRRLKNGQRSYFRIDLRQTWVFDGSLSVSPIGRHSAVAALKQGP